IHVLSIEKGESLALEAAASAAASAAPPGVETQPELAAAAVARLAENDDLRAGECTAARRRAEGQSFAGVAGELDRLYRTLARRRRPARADADPLAGRSWITVDL